MRKIFNYFVIGGMLLFVFYFASTFVYEAFFTDKIQARADTLEQVYTREFGCIQHMSDIQKAQYYTVGYRLCLKKEMVVKKHYGEVVQGIKELAKTNEWIHAYDAERDRYHYFDYLTKDGKYRVEILAYKETENKIASKIEVFVTFNDFYEKYGL